MNQSQRIALYGGTFDPFHQGHLFLIQQAIDQAKLDAVIVLPCQISPHKKNASTTGFHHRSEMIKIACRGIDKITIDDYESTQAPPSYSWRTVEHFRATLPHAEFFWILGFDQWQALPQWANPDFLAKNLTFLVFARDKSPSPRSGWRMQELRGTHPASATAIREPTSPHYRSPHWLHPGVRKYIAEHHLYENIPLLTPPPPHT